MNHQGVHKKTAAEHAVQFVESGMVVGLGHGSTAIHAVRKIAELVKTGELKNILGVPCSREVEVNAKALGIPLTTLETHPTIDLTIDGADEIDPDLNLIKGGGGALLQEKIVAQVSRREIIVADDSKLSNILGSKWPVPIEVFPTGWNTQAEYLESIGGKPTLRVKENGEPFLTDQKNLIVDCAFGPIADPESLTARLDRRAGIIGHGLFLGLATDVIVAGPEGIQHLKAKR